MSRVVGLALLLLLVCPWIAAADDGAAKRPVVVVAAADDEYETARTVPAFLAREFGDRLDVRVVAVSDLKDPAKRYDLAGLPEALKTADLLVVCARRTPLPKAQLDSVRAYVAAGKPVVGIRVACHAFHIRNKPAPEGLTDWPTFDPEVIGGHYDNHYGVGPVTTVTLAPGAQEDAILKGVEVTGWTSPGSLYRVSPLESGTRPLLMGTIPGQAAEPVAWTYQRKDGGKTFFTSLGHPADFEQASFVRMLKNAVEWALVPRG
jgi:type 1 glutamine amidotransferase